MAKLKVLKRAIMTWSWLILLGLLGTQDATARKIHSWTMEEIGSKAKAIVVGEVMEVVVAGRIPAEKTEWHEPLLKMRAKIRVLRIAPGFDDTAWVPKATFWLWYSKEDLEHGAGIPSGPEFPDLAVGESYAFPLSYPVAGNFELIHEENHGLLVPSIREAPAAATATNAFEFLQDELANTLSKGDFGALWRVSVYAIFCRTDTLDSLREKIEQRIGDDEDRWIKILTVIYGVAGPIQKLTEQPAPQDQSVKIHHFGLHEWLTAMTMRHVHRADWKKRYAATALAYLATRPASFCYVAAAIRGNFPTDPDVLALVDKAVEARQPGALALSEYLIDDKDHPLLGRALNAAMTELAQGRDLGYGDFSEACGLIMDYGTEAQFMTLVKDFRRTQRTDRDRYKAIWSACQHRSPQRLIELCRIAIQDTDSLGRVRLCDTALVTLADLIGKKDLDIGWASSVAERDAAIAKAKAWLAEHPQTTR